MPSPAKQFPGRNTQRGPPLAAGAGSVLDRIKPIAFDDTGIKILLYGRSGTGKTTLWATFPGPILAITASGGLRPGELRSIDTPEYRKKVSEVALHDTSEMRVLLQHLAETPRFKTVVLDHVTGYQDLCLKEILGLQEIPVQKSWGLASQAQYGQCVTQCKEAFRHLLNLNANVVFIGQERTFGEGKESEVIDPTVGVNLMPQLAQWLNPAVDYIGQTCIRPKLRTVQTQLAGETVTMQERVAGAVEYCLRTGPHANYITKFRRPKGFGMDLPEYIVDPDYAKIMKLIKAS